MKAAAQVGGVRIERSLSRGEHSELFRAWSEELQRPVMIKMLSPRYPAGSRTAKRFLRGGRLAMTLEHPNIVRTFAAGEDRGRPHMLMEYVEGHSLDRVLESRRKLTPEVATGIVRQVAKALELAGEKGIVHRAIEPSHIMLSPGGRVTVLGFGMAREADVADAGITAEGALVNVGPYAPPETGEAHQDRRSDFYSLGCVYYHLLSGRLPFAGKDPLELLRMHREEDPWPLMDLVPGLSPAIAELVHRLLRKRPEERVEHASLLISLIDAAVSPEILGAQGVKPDATLVATTLQMLAIREQFTVLVCEAQEWMLHALRETLRRLGTTLLCARSGRAALETLAGRKVDLVVTDLKLPHLAGEELLKKLHAAAPGCPILLTRTGPLAERLHASGAYPVVACLSRPTDFFALRERVRRLLQERATRR